MRPPILRAASASSRLLHELASSPFDCHQRHPPAEAPLPSHSLPSSRFNLLLQLHTFSSTSRNLTRSQQNRPFTKPNSPREVFPRSHSHPKKPPAHTFHRPPRACCSLCKLHVSTGTARRSTDSESADESRRASFFRSEALLLLLCVTTSGPHHR
ncbi:hypothetical protein V8C26DRAFT_389937 [Trichoderma gracile]